MKSTKTMVLGALMTALCVIIGWVCKAYFTFGAIRVTFENIPVMLSGILLGPAVGFCVGAAADVISALLSGFSVNPVITLGSACIGLVAGVLAKYVFKNRGYFSILAVSLLSHIVGSMIIKSYGLWMYGYDISLLLMRIPLYTAIGTSEAYIIYIILKNKVVKRGGREN